MLTGTAADDRPLLLLDTSAAIAVLLEDHERHDAAVELVRGLRLGLAGHAWFETYSVLTRLPPGQRRSPADVLRLLAHNFPESRFLTPEYTAQLGRDLARLGISGGAVYDALVAAVAREQGVDLVSADSRAQATYDALAIAVKRLA